MPWLVASYDKLSKWCRNCKFTPCYRFYIIKLQDGLDMLVCLVPNWKLYTVTLLCETITFTQVDNQYTAAVQRITQHEHIQVLWHTLILIYQPSPFFKFNDFENYKSLDAYDRFVSGWVKDVATYRYTHEGASKCQYCVVRARVLYSQRMNETPLHPWIIFEDNVISAHCDCMAGLGESCSHVASVLFYLEAAVRLRESCTVTQKSA